MVCVGSFKSLKTMLCGPRLLSAPLAVHTWVPTSIALISPLVDWLMNLITTAHCVCGEEQLVELALREALSNAMLHGNRLETGKLVHVHCRCEPRREIFVVVSDQGRGFDPNQIPNPLAVENLSAERGRGIHLIKVVMDEVSFEHGGTEVHMRKRLGLAQRTCAPALCVETFGDAN